MNKKLPQEIILRIQNWEGFQNFDGTNLEFNSEDPEIFSDCEISVLMMAIEKDEISVVHELCKAGVDVNRVAKGTRQTPLTCFEEDAKKTFEIAKILIEFGADVNYYKTYEGLFDEGDHFLNPLTVACNIGNFDHIKLLIQNGADVNFSITPNGSTPLCSVDPKFIDYLKTLQLFLEYGAKVNAGYGQTLTIAVEESNIDAIKLLIEAGADSNISSKSMIGNGKSAIMTLMVGFCEDITEEEEELLFTTLLENCNNINEQDTSGQSILFYSFDALIGGYDFDLKCFSLIINHKDIDVNVIDKDGNNALTKLMLKIEDWESSDEEIFSDDDKFRITTLINKGIDIFQENIYGRSPKSIAEDIGNPTMIQLFGNHTGGTSGVTNQDFPDQNKTSNTKSKHKQNSTNLNSHHNRVLEIIREIKIDGKKVPKSVNDLPDINCYGDYEEIINLINKKELQISIPNFKLFGSHDFVISKSEKNKSSIFLFIPYVLAIIISLYGISIDNYLLLLTIPTAFITPLMSSLFNGIFANLVLVAACFYYLYNEEFTLGLICFVAIVSTLSTKLLKIRRRKTLIKLAKSNEEIFSFLFYNRTIAFVDKIDGDLIYSSE